MIIIGWSTLDDWEVRERGRSMIGKFEERGVAWEEDLASNDVDMELDDEVFDGENGRPLPLRLTIWLSLTREDFQAF